jgi:phosphoenolpyruvate-protein kinase (PTS system EI component)
MKLPARFSGLPVSAGTAAGVLAIIGDRGDGRVGATPEAVAAAFAAVAAERSALAARLRAAGRGGEADIIEIGALIAADPALCAAAVAAVRGGADAATAVRETAERHAVAMERLQNPALAQRAGDIRQVASAVLDRLGTDRGDSFRPGPRAGTVAGPTAGPTAGTDAADFILVSREVSPADLIQLAETGLVGAVSVAGGASSHAAIIARGLGLPMIAGVDPAVLALAPGQAAVLDADSGELVVGAQPILGGPGTAGVQDAAGVRGVAGTRRAAGAQTVTGSESRPAGPARTADGREVVVLCNVASAIETRRGLAAGAAGVGLLRSEIPYVRAAGWPTRAQHLSQLGPILALLAGRTATVRLLDFSGDKIPPFLAAETGAGLAALLEHPFALADQLRAILEAGPDAHVGVLIPMVSALGEVSRVRAGLAETAVELGRARPPLGIMVELTSTAENAAAFAPAVDFFSIGTNDLSGDVLGLDRRDQAAEPGLAAHPRVLALVKGVAETGGAAGIPVSVCGDAAADPRVLPLLVGVGVRTVSVAAARVATVRSWISKLNAVECEELAARALRASSAAQVWDLVPAL